MSNGMLPNYLRMASPTPADKRAPWHKSTAPAYAGIFLWVVFYMAIAQNTLPQAGLALSLLALVVAALLCHFFYYLVPGLLGQKTGYPLYVVGSSTYGTVGGFILPGLLMGLLQFGWLAVNTIVAIIWAFVAVFVAMKGIQYLGKVSTFLPVVPLIMILIVFFANVGSAGKYQPAPDAKPLMGFLAMIGIVVGFFATAGAAGVDFGMGNRNAKDVHLGGLFGIALAIVIAGGLPLIAVAGAHAANPEMTGYTFDAVIKQQGGFLETAMFLLFAVASFAPACFSSFIGVNSITTMFPRVNRVGLVCAGAVVAIILAATGWALNLVSVFGIIGASFGPICGSMVADYLLSGRKWPGPRKGINWAGYIAWAVGFVVAILPMIAPSKFGFIAPAPVIAFVIGFVLYAVLAKAGLEPEVVALIPAEQAPKATEKEQPADQDKPDKATES